MRRRLAEGRQHALHAPGSFFAAPTTASARFGERRIAEAAAEQFELHLEAAGVADALDRRRHEHEGPAVGQSSRPSSAGPARAR